MSRANAVPDPMADDWRGVDFFQLDLQPVRKSFLYIVASHEHGSDPLSIANKK
jgi:hypothetical protein